MATSPAAHAHAPRPAALTLALVVAVTTVSAAALLIRSSAADAVTIARVQTSRRLLGQDLWRQCLRTTTSAPRRATA